MKKHLKLIYVLSTILILANCTAKDNQVNTSKEKEVAVEKTETPEKKDIKQKPKPPEKSAWQIAREKRNKKAKDYEEKLEKLEDELDKKREFIKKQVPLYTLKKELDAGKCRANFYDYDNKSFAYITFTELKENKDTYYGKQKLTTPKGKILEYGITYKAGIKKEEENTYYVSNIDLITQIDIIKTENEIIEKQVHGEICNLKNDKDSEEIKKIFEEYENEKYPYTDEWNKLAVLDYVKGNFTNSGYDEYFVMFYENDGRDFIQGFNILRIKCFIVSNKKILKEYYINSLGGIGFHPDPNINYLDYSRNIVHKLKDFGFQFSQGWVNDFNQNGRNEIYFASQLNFDDPVLFIIEFDDKEFITNYVSTYSYEINSVDWKTKTIETKHQNKLNKYTNIGNFQIDVFRWNENSNEFIFEKKEYIMEE